MPLPTERSCLETIGVYAQIWAQEVVPSPAAVLTYVFIPRRVVHPG